MTSRRSLEWKHINDAATLTTSTAQHHAYATYR